MNENEHKDNAEVPDRISCRLKLPHQEPTDAECYISEGRLVVTGKPPIVIPLHRIKTHMPGGLESREIELTYLDDLDKKQRMSLEMDNPQHFDLQLDRAIEKAKARWLESLPVGERYAGFWRRFVAYLLDGIILNIISWVLYFILIFLPYQMAIVIYIAFFIGSILYFPIFWAWQGATPGKMIMGIEIVKTDGRPIGIGRAIVRYIGYFVSAIIIYIGYLMIAMNKKKQGLHDMIAGTIVIRV